MCAYDKAGRLLRPVLPEWAGSLFCSFFYFSIPFRGDCSQHTMDTALNTLCESAHYGKDSL